MTKDFLTLDDFNLENKRVILRVDINSPINPMNGNILDDSRLKRHSTTIKNLSHSKLIILAHQSRPGKDDFTTMDRHALRLSRIIGKNVKYVDSLFESNAIDEINNMKKGDAEEVVMKNIDPGKMSKSHLVRKLAENADYFVIDCFGAAHRAQPSIIGFSEVLPALAGRVMEKELKMLDMALQSGKKPRIGIFGGIKVDDSIDIIHNLLRKNIVDRIFATGAVANIFLMADGKDVGSPNAEFLMREVDGVVELLGETKSLIDKYRDRIELPIDFALNDNGKRKHIGIDDLPTTLEINDIGLDTIVHYSAEIAKAKTIILNGPPGVFEKEEFSLGTIETFKAVAKADAFKVVGGGHTIAAMEQYGLSKKIDHLSTGGGSLVNYLAGKNLPAVEALKKSKKRFESGGYKKK
jgi:phosphoglycerate kinase